MWRVSTSIVTVVTQEFRSKTATQPQTSRIVHKFEPQCSWSYSKGVFGKCKFHSSPEPVQVCQVTKEDFFSCRFPNLPRNPVQPSTSTGYLVPKPCSLISCKMRPTWNGWWEHALFQVACVAHDGILWEGIINAQSRVMIWPNTVQIYRFHTSVSLKIRRVQVQESVDFPLQLLQDFT